MPARSSTARARADHRQLRRQADPLPGRLDRRARGQRDRQRPRGGGRAPARAHALARARGGLGADVLRAEVEAIAARPRRPGSRSSPATRRWSSAATPTRCTSARPGSAGSIRAPRSRPAALRPGDRILVSGHDRRARHGDHARPRRVRARRRRSSRTRARCGRRSTRCSSRRAGAALPARRDPRRRRLGAERAGPRLGRGDGRARGGGPGAAGGRGRGARSSGSTRCTSPTRASWSRSSRPRRRTRRWRRCARVPGCEHAAEIGEVKTEPPGMVLVETAFGGRRVMDLLVGDPLPRIC